MVSRSTMTARTLEKILNKRSFKLSGQVLQEAGQLIGYWPDARANAHSTLATVEDGGNVVLSRVRMSVSSLVTVVPAAYNRTTNWESPTL